MTEITRSLNMWVFFYEIIEKIGLVNYTEMVKKSRKWN